MKNEPGRQFLEGFFPLSIEVFGADLCIPKLIPMTYFVRQIGHIMTPVGEKWAKVDWKKWYIFSGCQICQWDIQLSHTEDWLSLRSYNPRQKIWQKNHFAPVTFIEMAILILCNHHSFLVRTMKSSKWVKSRLNFLTTEK